jgi:hypothetical protein
MLRKLDRIFDAGKKVWNIFMQRQRRITPLHCGIYHSFQARTLAEGEKASLQKVPPAEVVYLCQHGFHLSLLVPATPG